MAKLGVQIWRKHRGSETLTQFFLSGLRSGKESGFQERRIWLSGFGLLQHISQTVKLILGKCLIWESFMYSVSTLSL